MIFSKIKTAYSTTNYCKTIATETYEAMNEYMYLQEIAIELRTCLRQCCTKCTNLLKILGKMFVYYKFYKKCLLEWLAIKRPIYSSIPLIYMYLYVRGKYERGVV